MKSFICVMKKIVAIVWKHKFSKFYHTHPDLEIAQIKFNNFPYWMWTCLRVRPKKGSICCCLYEHANDANTPGFGPEPWIEALPCWVSGKHTQFPFTGRLHRLESPQATGITQLKLPHIHTREGINPRTRGEDPVTQVRWLTPHHATMRSARKSSPAY